ncbi:protein kinase family protein [Salininema proteolyticum]|uniref:Serine/threonine protein kinase n=1 Tax=Salininema proteolyticum TaxID=1607685 RepID=A0ABV8U196_9ACTN
MTDSADLPEVGELLAQRYRLDEYVGGDGGKRSLWRGTDVILNRTVALVIRVPGGDEAVPTMNAAVAASRVVSSSMVSVYDAVDEGRFAYVVREWVDGEPLSAVLESRPLPEPDALELVASIADPVTALHDVAIAHGHLHPATLLLSEDDRIMVTEPYNEEGSTAEDDVRALGGLLYAGLTGYWPAVIPSSSILSPAPLAEDGSVQPAHLVNPDVSEEVSELAASLVEGTGDVTTAAQVADRFRELADKRGREGFDALAGTQVLPASASAAEPALDETAVAPAPAAPEPAPQAGLLPRESSAPASQKEGSARRHALVAAVAGVAVIAVILAGVFLFGEDSEAPPENAGSEETQSEDTDENEQPEAPVPADITAADARIVDPPDGKRDELSGVENLFDDDPDTGWSTDRYNPPATFGNLKPGMGILVDLGEETEVASVRVGMHDPGAEVGLLSGDEDYGDSSEGDLEIVEKYSEAVAPSEAEANVELRPDGELKTRYIVVWVTSLPQTTSGYKLTVSSIDVFVRE